ncbi:hypothetical protein CYMTET_45626 [Cymbomonas tetramitiformis]|uniref:Uncharacterized protein n=1 Tax=Cymbomonas tetramitiformis TaxID=36881 RepID=A0AAE0EY48_9CHLO|nr:hypothetical protein CYMTET_47078 [Cymbomonas tetramitiformis]KAK3244778.1 hypothetical protein CYMTET_45626 [Cymbomonas tetramitiformis]
MAHLWFPTLQYKRKIVILGLLLLTEVSGWDGECGFMECGDSCPSGSTQDMGLSEYCLFTWAPYCCWDGALR